MKKTITTSYTDEEFKTLIKEAVKSAINGELDQPSKEEGFLTISQAADLLKLKAGSIYNMVNSQTIPFHKKPGSNRLLFVKSELLEWLKEDKK
jgi:excisionase family DNA binding protein